MSQLDLLVIHLEDLCRSISSELERSISQRATRDTYSPCVDEAEGGA